MLPITEAVDAFRSDTKVDELPCTTGSGETTDNLTLTHEVYEDDTTGMTLLSSDGDDTPVLSSYDSTYHSIYITGLADNTTRTITATYYISAMTIWTGIDTLLNMTPMIWYISIVAFIPLALIVIWRDR